MKPYAVQRLVNYKCVACVQYVTADVATDCMMVRAGTSSATAIIQLYHNDDRCNDDTKHEYAERIAEYLAHDIRIPEDRVLVLFHDTRSCSGHAN
ncbi:uncharacterized protein [Littorina saxatilis]|uniref:Uncharacterized protein n=1 Tax=Littorina saxatilis TaxID=31220 RepID=A0AAN9B2K7_9CAEN